MFVSKYGVCNFVFGGIFDEIVFVKEVIFEYVRESWRKNNRERVSKCVFYVIYCNLCDDNKFDVLFWCRDSYILVVMISGFVMVDC